MILENLKPLLASLYDSIKPSIRPGISGAIDGAAIGAVTTIIGIATVELLKTHASSKKTSKADSLATGIIYFVTTLAGTAIGSAGGVVYKLGRDVLLLQPTTTCALTIATMGVSGVIISKQFNY